MKHRFYIVLGFILIAIIGFAVLWFETGIMWFRPQK